MSKIIDAFVKYCGFADNINSAKENISNLTCDKYFLSDLLTYRDYDPSNNIFINESSIGSLIELTPLVGITDDQINNLEYLFSEIEQDYILQFLLVASNDISKPIESWKGDTNKHKSNHLLDKIITKREIFFKSKAQTLDAKLPVRDFKIFLSISTNNNIEELLKFREALTSKFDTIGINSSICDAYILKKLVLEITSINQDGIYHTKYDPYTSIKNQIYSSIDEKLILEDRIDHAHNNYSSILFNITKYPKEFSLKHIINLLGSPNINLGISGRFAISLIIDTKLSKSQESKLLAKAARAIKLSNTKLSTANMRLEAKEWQNLLDQRSINPKMIRFFNTNLTILITTQNIDKSIAELKSLYNSNGFEIEIAGKLQLPLLLSILPFTPLWQSLINLKTTRIRLTKEVVSLLPVLAEYKGMQTIGVPLIGRRGQLFCFNNFVKLQDGNFNACIMAASGSGKSVFLQELVINHMRSNTKCFVLDIGKSFANIAKLTNSEVIEFSRESKLSINPFAVFNKELSAFDRQEFLQITIELLYLMCGVKEDDPLGKSKLSKETTRIVQTTNNLDITIFAEILCNSQDDQLNQYGITLFPYTKDGVYGRYFHGPNTLTFNSILTVFEFEEIRNDTRLLSILLQVLSIEITKQFLTGDRSQNFCIIIDEAWMLLDFAAPFFASFARTVRKYNGSLITCVQNLSDLSKTEAHKTILKNSAWTILLKQDEKGISSFKENEAFKDLVPLIKSLTLVPKKYAEILICATGISVVGRLALDAFSKALYSTDAKDFNYIQTQVKQGVKLENAIEDLSKRSA